MKKSELRLWFFHCTAYFDNFISSWFTFLEEVVLQNRSIEIDYGFTGDSRIIKCPNCQYVLARGQFFVRVRMEDQDDCQTGEVVRCSCDANILTPKIFETPEAVAREIVGLRLEQAERGSVRVSLVRLEDFEDSPAPD